MTTYSQLKAALDNEAKALARTMTYVEQTEYGAKFHDTYLKYVMDGSLLYRMFPAESSMKRYVFFQRCVSNSCIIRKIDSQNFCFAVRQNLAVSSCSVRSTSAYLGLSKT